MKSLIIVAVTLIIINNNSLAGFNYLYFDNKIKTIEISENDVTIALSKRASVNFYQCINKYNDLFSIQDIYAVYKDFYNINFSAKIPYSNIVNILRNDPDIRFVSPVILDSCGNKIYLTDKLEVKLVGANLNELNTILRQNSIQEITDSDKFNDIYIINLKNGKGVDPLKLANLIYESGIAEMSLPDFILPFSFDFIPNDSYFPDQYNLHVIDMPLAWEFTHRPDTVLIAVLDQGFEPHEDIDDLKWADGKNYIDLTPEDSISDDESPPDSCDYDYHGMAVTGIIVASIDNDSLGIASVAGNGLIRILGQRIGDQCTSSSSSIFASGLMLERAFFDATDSGASVMNLSWGCNICDQDFYYSVYAGVTYAFMHGVFIVCSSGNECSASTPNYCYFYIKFPACLKDTTFAVGACTQNNEIVDVSQGGPTLDCVAPGEWIYTTDRMGPNGIFQYKIPGNANYFAMEGCTSIAAPQVAGLAALLLMRRPDLAGEIDSIAKIIRYSCDNPMLINSPHDTTRINNSWGWGRINAGKAMLTISRGDANNDSYINIADAGYIIGYIFYNGYAPVPHELTGDANCDGDVNIVDAQYIIDYIFYGGPKPPFCFEFDNY